MLKVRPEQMEAFQPVADSHFVQRVGQFLRERHAQTVVRLPQGPTLISRLSDSLLSELVKNGLECARSYGLSWESSISGFIVLMFKAAPNFHQHAAVNASLTDSQIPPDERVKDILAKTSAAVWTEIKDSYDPAAWQPTPKGAQQ